MVRARSTGPAGFRHAQDNRLAVAMGCAIEHAAQIGFAEGPVGDHRTEDAHRHQLPHLRPRTGCDQRAHQAVIDTRPIDVRRRARRGIDG